MFRSISSDSRDSRGRFVSRPSQEQDAGGKGVVATVKKDWPRIWPAQMEGNRWAPSSDHHDHHCHHGSSWIVVWQRVSN